MLNHLLVRLTPVLLLLTLWCCHRSGASVAEPPLVSLFNQMDPLPRAVGTCRTTLGPGNGTQVQFWYPLAKGAPIAPRFVSCQEAIEKQVDEAEPALLVELSEGLQQRGVVLAPTKDAIKAYLRRSMASRAFEESALVHPTLAKGRLPMVILAHGSGGCRIGEYCSIAESLAAHGFLVAGLETAVNDPGLMKAWQELIFSMIASLQAGAHAPTPMLAWVGTHIDFDRIGMVGHSSGGRAAIHALSNPDHPGVIKAAVNLDGGIEAREALTQVSPLPLLILRIARHREKNEFLRALVATNNQRPGGASTLLDLGLEQPRFSHVDHLNFMDSVLLYGHVAELAPSLQPDLSATFGDLSSAVSRRTNAIEFHDFLNKRLADFFNKHLQN